MEFEEVMDFDPQNRESFAALEGNLGLTLPFVGAGLAAFAYPCWSDFLRGAAGHLGGAGRRDFDAAFRGGDYELAASAIEKTLGPRAFRRRVRAAFGPKRLYEPEFAEKARGEAAFVLPMLFCGLVLTTNFDRTLERIYGLAGVPFCHVARPGAGRPLVWLKKTREKGNTYKKGASSKPQGKNILYKFHGDIGRAGRLVITKERYDRCYRPGGRLSRGLRSCFENKHMLFLGCSLASDRTVEVLKDVLPCGTEHYAVADCGDGGPQERRGELAARGINAVIYPKGEYDAVRAVLKKLAEDRQGPI